MLFSRDYNSISSPTEALYTDKGSRFLSFAYPVMNEKEIKETLSALKLQYPDATHHCYAWVLNPDRMAFRANDDGEPSNTAGRPILKQINAMNLTNILVVVVRYFGGKKLGVPGLIEAYGNAARLCLDKVNIITKTLLDYFKIVTEFENEHIIYNIARRFSAEIMETSHAEKVTIVIAINGSKTEQLLNYTREMNNFELKFLKTE